MHKVRVVPWACLLMLCLSLDWLPLIINLCSKDVALHRMLKRISLLEPICHLALPWSNGIQNPHLLAQESPSKRLISLICLPTLEQSLDVPMATAILTKFDILTVSL